MPSAAGRERPANPAGDEIRWNADTGLLQRPAEPQPQGSGQRAPWQRDEGDVLRVALPPLAMLGAAAGGDTAGLAAREPAGRALLLEPDDELQRLVAKLLAHNGFEVRRAYTWNEALDVLAHERIDLLLTRNASINDNVHRETIRRLRQGVSVRIVDDYGALLAGQHERYERMWRGLLGALDMLVTLLEQASGDFSSHSRSVAQYARHVGRRLGMPRRDLDALTIAAYIHDLALLTEAGPQPDAAPSTARLLRLLEALDLPYDLDGILAPPDGGRPEDIPAAPRILAVVNAYEHFRCNDAETRSPAEAVAMLRTAAGCRFDPHVVEIFANVLRSDIVLRQLDRGSQRILVVTPDPSERETITLRFQNEGYVISVAAGVREAVAAAQASPPSGVVARHDLEDGDGFELLRRLREEGGVTAAPMFFLLSSIDHDATRRLLQEGAEDVIPGSVNTEVIAVKLNRSLERLGHLGSANETDDCVRGRIEDLGLIEAVQILCAGGRSGTVHLQAGDQAGFIILCNGRVVHAECGDMEPTEAFVEMVSWREGRFRIEKSAGPVEPTIRMSTESLILEACRRLDETAPTAGAVR